MTKVVLLLAPLADDDGQLRAVLADLVGQLRRTLGQEYEVRAALALDQDEIKSVMGQGDRGGYESRSPYRAAIWAAGPAGRIDELAAAVGAVRIALAGSANLSRSAAIAGTEETFIPGDGAVVSMFSFRRPLGMDRASCHDYWRLQHTKLSMLVPGFRYRQLHDVPFASECLAQAAGVALADYDGVVVMHMDSLAWQHSIAELPLVGQLYEDEKNFIDHRRSEITYFECLSDAS